MEEIRRFLVEYESILVNRLETQTRQPALYFSAILIDHELSYEIMKLLIDHGANPHFKDSYQQTVLFYVCRDGKDKCLDLLLEQGLDLEEEDAYGQTPLYYAAKENRLNIIHKLLEHKGIEKFTQPIPTMLIVSLSKRLCSTLRGKATSKCARCCCRRVVTWAFKIRCTNRLTTTQRRTGRRKWLTISSMNTRL
jgi:hypothetical protein